MLALARANSGYNRSIDQTLSLEYDHLSDDLKEICDLCDEVDLPLSLDIKVTTYSIQRAEPMNGINEAYVEDWHAEWCDGAGELELKDLSGEGVDLICQAILDYDGRECEI